MSMIYIVKYSELIDVGGHHSYANAKDVESAYLLDEEDKVCVLYMIYDILL
jgi:hypothetical protein